MCVCHRIISCHRAICTFSVHRLVTSVCRVWVNNSTAKGYTEQQMQRFNNAFLLRHKMLNFVQHLQYYIMIEVIDSYWTEFEASLKNVRSILPPCNREGESLLNSWFQTHGHILIWDFCCFFFITSVGLMVSKALL